jgi:hypothetical protein
VDDRPQILSLTYTQVTGVVSLEYRGLACAQYAIQSSTNLMDWIDRTNQASGLDGHFIWINENELDRPVCFYRVRQL